MKGMSAAALSAPPHMLVKATEVSSRVIALAVPAPRRARLPTLRRVVTENILPPVIVIATLIGLWQFATGAGTGALPSPLQVWADSGDLILRPFYVAGTQDMGLGWRVLTSLERVGMGFGLAAVVGVLVGAVIGQSVWLMRGVDPLFQILRTVPPLAWLPLSLAAFMDSRPSAIFVIFITAIWPIIINTTAGVRAIPQDYRNVAAELRLNHAQFFFKIMIPAAAPYIFSGLRIGVGLAWLAIVAAEMLTGGVGIGFFIWDAWNSALLSDIVVALLYIGVTGFVLDRLVAFIGLFIDGDDPMGLLRHVDADEDGHGILLLSVPPSARQSGHADIALHSHQRHRAISGRTGTAVRAAQPPEPSRAARMTTIPAPPAHPQSGRMIVNAQQQGKAE